MFRLILTFKCALTSILVIGFCIFQMGFGVSSACAEPENQDNDSQSGGQWYEEIESEWGGHFRLRGSISWIDDESYLGLVDSGAYQDGSAEFRLKNKLSLTEWAYLDTHYEAVLAGGDTRESMNQLMELFGAFLDEFSVPGSPIEDDRRLMDLTKTVTENDRNIIYHRLDRLSLTLLPDWGSVRVGRQAITWGNGFLFNPMDLFNPFSPTDIERDYKVGDDMAVTQFHVDRVGDFQFLYVPRRDPVDRDVKWERSSLAGKLHFPVGTTEFDVMGASHYEDYVVGLGSTGYLGDTAWRMDATWTFLEGEGASHGFVSYVANMDYSWVWWQKNFYGFLEFYYNGLGEDDYSRAITDPDIVERVGRGELFTLGRAYLGGLVQAELHPLFSVYLSVINNLEDPSGVIQPRAIWDFAEDFQLTIGGNISYGSEDTEFGGFDIPGTNVLIKSPNSIFLWLSYYF